MDFLYELESTELDRDFTAEVLDGLDRHIFICQQEFESRIRNTLEKFGQVHLQDDFGQEVGIARLELICTEYNEDGEPNSATVLVRLLKKEAVFSTNINLDRELASSITKKGLELIWKEPSGPGW